MKKMLMMLVLAVVMFLVPAIVHAEMLGTAYSTTVCNGVIGVYTDVDVSTTVAVIRIHKLTISCTNDEFNTQSVTLYGGFTGAGVKSTSTLTAIYRVDFGTCAINTGSNATRFIQETYPDFLPLIAKKGLAIRKSNDNSVVKVSIVYR